jgi:hypothetical protein
MSEREELKQCGGVPLADGFSQRSFRGGTVIPGVNIENGYCAGVALDWTRRVLQPNNRQGIARTGSAHLDYASLKPERNLPTLKRMVAAKQGSAASYVNESPRSIVRRRLAALQTEDEVQIENYGLGVPIPTDLAVVMSKVWPIPGASNSSFTRFNLSSSSGTSGTLRKAKIAQFLVALNAPDPQQEPNAGDGRDWTNYARVLDEQFRTIRLSETRQVTARPFSDLRVVRSSPFKDYASAATWAGTLLADGLTVNCCTIVSIKPDSDSKGHQIAIHQKRDDEFVLFDPNYGSFRCSGGALRKCLRQLFVEPCLLAEGTGHSARILISDAMIETLDGDLAVYRRREHINAPAISEWKAMGYTVFEKVT